MSDASIEPIVRAERPLPVGTTIGHVHLRTADIDRTREFVEVRRRTFDELIAGH